MSITLSNCQQINQCPLNNSTSKMLYSFSKEPRFAKRRIILCDKFYDVKSHTQFRATSLGFGDKYDFTKDGSCSPPPNIYNIQDQFRKNIKKGFGFGKGREQMQITGPFVSTKKNKIPGPGTYQLPSMLQKHAFSLRSKINTFDNSKKSIPGPGAYPVTFNINQKGKYFLAKYKSSYVRDFGKYQGRCHTSQQKVPGPGSYSVQGIDLSPQGRYISSKLHNCLVKSFNGSQRKFLGQKTNTPGPGNYRLPSDFGYYDVQKKKHQTLKRSRGKEEVKIESNDQKQKIEVDQVQYTNNEKQNNV